MAYPAITSRRMPYDIDGTAVGWSNQNAAVNNWFSGADVAELNDEDDVTVFSYGSGTTPRWVTLFLPETREIEAIWWDIRIQTGDDNSQVQVYGSTDTTNGLDGTWESATFPSGKPGAGQSDDWRDEVKPVSFSGAKRALRFVLPSAGTGKTVVLRAIHVYGRKAAGQTPDDIIFLDDDTMGDPEFTAVEDWGDRPEGTTETRQIRVKNASSTKTANNVNLQLNHAHFGMSFNAGGPFQATLDIASLAPGAASSTIYIRNEIPAPPQTLGPQAARIIGSVGSWT